uniref:Uncharacterized protein n=1 Tax=Vitrella brassicaformis TaxID=1169539 RepID=A0A7S1JW64_9ALVE
MGRQANGEMDMYDSCCRAWCSCEASDSTDSSVRHLTHTRDVTLTPTALADEVLYCLRGAAAPPSTTRPTALTGIPPHTGTPHPSAADVGVEAHAAASAALGCSAARLRVP